MGQSQLETYNFQNEPQKSASVFTVTVNFDRFHATFINKTTMLQLDHISYRVTNKNSAPSLILKDISLTLEKGGCVAIIGESGCGKSTLLNHVYGLLPYQEGKTSWNKEPLLGADHHLVPGHEMMKYVPQEFDLMPFTTVFENVGEHLSIQIDDRADRINELLEVVDMTAYDQRKVKTLSGGQKQRVAIAKALAQEPELLLLDESFSHIDNFRKNDLRRKLFSYLKTNNISCMIATHDSEDVLAFTDKTIVMKDGRIIDHRHTTQVYAEPLDHYCASLFDEVSLIDGRYFNLKNDLILYPHQLAISDSGIEVEVTNSYFDGKDFLIKARFNNQPVYFRNKKKIDAGTLVTLSLAETTKRQ
jgi:ABC-type nitrate/sulfonate/bicarbonate transport system ATPase subunit